MAKQIQINTNRGNGSIYDQDNPIQLPDGFGDVIATGIIKRDDSSIEVGNIVMHRVGLEFLGQVSEDEYEVFGETLLKFDTAYQWIVGDYLAYGTDNNYGMAVKFAEQLDRESSTIHNWTSVCRQVEFSRRRENLSFFHHSIIAPFDPDDQAYWLGMAQEKGWSAKRLRNEIAKANGSDIDTVKKSAYEKMVKPLQSRSKLWKSLTPAERQKVIRDYQDALADFIEWQKYDLG